MESQFSDTNFEAEVLKSDVPVFVDFWAPWCGPCQIMGPIVDELAAEYAGKTVKIGKCNVDENSTIASRFEIMSIPSFLVFKGGQVADKIVGGVQKERLKEMIDKYV